jgi:hypothetical protein
MENELLDKLSAYGKIKGWIPHEDCLKASNPTKIREKTATDVGDSFYKNNIYVIGHEKDFEVGLYFSWDQPIKCELWQAYTDPDSFDGRKAKVGYYVIKNKKELSDDEFRAMVGEVFGGDLALYDECAYRSRSNTYYELTASKDGFQLYVEFNGECITLDLEREAKVHNYIWTSEKFLRKITADGFTVSSDSSLKNALEEQTKFAAKKYIDLGIRKIKNGYILGDEYFATFEEVEDKVKETETIKEGKQNG